MNWVLFPCRVSELLQPQLHCCLNRFEGNRGSPHQRRVLLSCRPGSAALRSSSRAAALASAVPQTGGATQAGAASWGFGIPEQASGHAVLWHLQECGPDGASSWCRFCLLL